ncbi:MAG: hypothetical protein KGM42_16305 [Hyphomicrobiales bacterium]|nr:hypothetical protein [Hyphomicrobiales bacterium]
MQHGSDRRHLESSISWAMKDILVQVVFVCTLAIIITFFASRPKYDEQRSNDAQGIATHQKQPESFWEKTSSDPVATFTAALAILTAGLVIVSAVQIRFLIRADNTARDAARAASDSAKAMTASEGAYIVSDVPSRSRIDKPVYFQYIPAADVNAAPILDDTYICVVMTFLNYGKTPATIIGFRAGLEIDMAAPFDSEFFDKATVNDFMIDPDVMRQNEPVSTIPIGRKVESATELDRQLRAARQNLWLAGYIRYEDVFGKQRTTDFLWRYDRRVNRFRRQHILKDEKT